jgi:hypothetical protein
MLWLAASLFFCWCAYREIRGSIVAPPGYDFPAPITKPYLAAVLALSVGFAWPPVSTWYFERFLSIRASLLADPNHATVHCNTIFDTMLDSEMLAAGHANPATGKIAIQHPWCGTLRSYLRHPARANAEELESLDIFTHESMHIRGELNEARTECQAVQRNYRAAKMLGVPATIAKKNALDYYTNDYLQRGQLGIMQAAYVSDQCAPGKQMDEHLPDSTWSP